MAMSPADIVQRLGGPASTNVAVGVARGETPGEIHELLRGLSPAELAELDRYSQAALMSEDVPAALAPFVGPVAVAGSAANEASKAIPGAQDLIGRIITMLGGNGEQFATAPGQTSPPSFRNVSATARGFLAGLTGY